MNKKLSLIFLGLILLFGLFPCTALAAEEEGIGAIFETIYEFFSWIPRYITLEKLMSGDERALFIARFLIWIIIFSAVYFGLKFIESKGVRSAVGVVIAIMGAALIPAEILVNIFQTYTLIGAVLVWAIPMLFGWVMINKISKEHSFIRAFIYLLILIVLWNINMTMDELTGAQFGKIEDWLGYFKILYLFAAIGFGSNLLRGFTGRGFGDRLPGASRASAGLRSRFPNVSDLWNRIRTGEASDERLDRYIGELHQMEGQLRTQRTNLDNEDYQTGELREQVAQRVTTLQTRLTEIRNELTRLGVRI